MLPIRNARKLLQNAGYIAAPVAVGAALGVFGFFFYLLVGIFSCAAMFGPPSFFKKPAPYILAGCVMGYIIGGLRFAPFAN